MAGPHTQTARLVTTLVEPLVDTPTRAMIEEDFTAGIDGWSVWIGLWGTGALAGALSSLPPDDPWRHLAARINGHWFGDPNTPAATSGDHTASPLGRFGTSNDHDDLVLPETTGDRLSDIGVAGGHTTMSVSAGALLAGSARSWIHGMEVWWGLLRGGIGPTHPARDTRHNGHLSLVPATPGKAADPIGPQMLASSLLEALRAVLFRRRCYLGGFDDSFAVHAVTGFAWCDELDRMIDSADLDRAADADAVVRFLGGFDGFSRWSWPDPDEIPDSAYGDFKLL